MDHIVGELQAEQGTEGSVIGVAGWALRIEVTRDDVRLSDVLRANVVRRVLLALSRFGPRVRKVTVCLAEPVNLLGGVDQRCRMRASLRESDDIRVEVMSGDFEATEPLSRRERPAWGDVSKGSAAASHRMARPTSRPAVNHRLRYLAG